MPKGGRGGHDIGGQHPALLQERRRGEWLAAKELSLRSLGAFKNFLDTTENERGHKGMALNRLARLSLVLRMPRCRPRSQFRQVPEQVGGHHQETADRGHSAKPCLRGRRVKLVGAQTGILQPNSSIG